MSQPVKEGAACHFCASPAIGQAYGVTFCLEHVGDAIHTVQTEDGKIDPNAVRVVDTKKQTKGSDSNGN